MLTVLTIGTIILAYCSMAVVAAAIFRLTEWSKPEDESWTLILGAVWPLTLLALVLLRLLYWVFIIFDTVTYRLASWLSGLREE